MDERFAQGVDLVLIQGTSFQGTKLDKRGKILLTGTTGMVGAATQRFLRKRGFENILAPTRAALDLQDQRAVFEYFELHKPAYVLMVAAKVGGIAANAADPVGFLDANMRMTLNLFAACDKFKTRKNLFLGSSCIYPRESPQPIREEYLLTGPLEPTNEGYALAKIAGLKIAKYYHEQRGMNVVCPMPCNIYGTGDHFDPQRSHVLSALVRRFVDGRDSHMPAVTMWGTGRARREFVHVDDVARAILFFMENVDSPEHINVGAGTDISIRELADVISRKAGYKGEILWDSSKPDGMLRKCLDVSRMRDLGLELEVALDDGISRTIAEYEKLKAQGAIAA